MSFWAIAGGMLGGLLSRKRKRKEPEPLPDYKPQNVEEAKIPEVDFDKQVERSKELANFRLGLDQQQANFMGGLRENEFQNQFGRQTQFERQQQEGRESLTNIQQSALTGRLEKELANRLEQQDKGITQDNLRTNRAIALASRRLGTKR